MFDLLVKNGRLVCSDGVKEGSLAVRDGKIVALLPVGQEAEGRKVVDAAGCYVLPGAVDDHVHFNEPGYTWREDFRHGSRAAAKGGVTTVIDMPMQNLPPVSSAKIMQKKIALLTGKSLVDYALWGALIRSNRDKLSELQAHGAAAFKCFMCDPGKDYTDLRLGEIADRLNLLKSIGGLAGFHCEDYTLLKKGKEDCLSKGKVSPQDYLTVHSVEAERRAVSDIIRLAKGTGARVHICHVSHPLVAELIRQAKEEGVNLTAETCMHYLLLTEEDLLQRGGICKCSPPLRSREAVKQLWEYVADGTLDTICSDHSPCQLAEKDDRGPKGIFGAWGGLSGVQNSLQSAWDYIVNQKQASPVLVARCLAENPARIFGLYGHKGELKAGFDADFVILDPEKKWQIEAMDLEYLHKFSAFCGLKGKGLPVATYLRGECIYKQNKFPTYPAGRFLPVMGGVMDETCDY
ncbi:allantoinase AllB [Selenomonas ruminantium]|uniref:allantoinase AllB n=1 Tax=Selenomonas ruminantium TaxID=971 RepID=UPI00156990C0|nr:allantoinase AllB [Selenomonas ruminantium]